jgi:hypothetical protein
MADSSKIPVPARWHKGPKWRASTLPLWLVSVREYSSPKAQKATNFTVICEFRSNDRNCPHLIDSFFTMRASLPKSHRKQPARML